MSHNTPKIPLHDGVATSFSKVRHGRIYINSIPLVCAVITLEGSANDEMANLENEKINFKLVQRQHRYFCSSEQIRVG